MSKPPSPGRVAAGFALAFLSSAATVFCVTVAWGLIMIGDDYGSLTSARVAQHGLAVAWAGLLVGIPVVLILGVPSYVIFRDRIERKRVFSVIFGVVTGLVVTAIGVSIFIGSLVVLRGEFLDFMGPFYVLGALSGAIGGVVFAGFVFTHDRAAGLIGDG